MMQHTADGIGAAPPGWRLTPALCRAARAALGWSQDDLAGAIGALRRVVLDFENGTRRPSPRNIAAMRDALEVGGVSFLTGSGVSGMLLRDGP